MKNYEKYEEKIREYEGETFCADFIQPYILKQDDCCGMDCGQCGMLQLIWLMKEYEEPKEPEVDWSKVEVDTPILVRPRLDGEWVKRHFAEYKNGDVYAWDNGRTSWTVANEIKWKYAKLAEDEKECKEAEVDWNNVEIDTPILVRDHESQEWDARHFAKYEDGVIYTWVGAGTSWTSNGKMVEWRYAKLAEDEEECKESEVDWSNVNVDTPILVGEGDGDWVKRYFAEYKDGIVYAWCGGSTSWDANNMMMSWNYAKLAENEE